MIAKIVFFGLDKTNFRDFKKPIPKPHTVNCLVYTGHISFIISFTQNACRNMYFDQLFLAARKVNVVYLEQLLGAAH